MKKNIRDGKLSLKSIVEDIAYMARTFPLATTDGILERFTELRPEVSQKENCMNCDASMFENIYEPDIFDALLLLQMAKIVRNHMDKKDDGTYLTFTQANRVHIDEISDYTVKSRRTKVSYLNFIVQQKGTKGSGVWVITTRGWEALRGIPVPKTVVVFRGKIEERGVEKITLSEMFKNHSDRVERAIERKKDIKHDYRNAFFDYNPQEWVEYGAVHEGNIVV